MCKGTGYMPDQIPEDPAADLFPVDHVIQSLPDCFFPENGHILIQTDIVVSEGGIRVFFQKTLFGKFLGVCPVDPVVRTEIDHVQFAGKQTLEPGVLMLDNIKGERYAEHYK